MMAQTNLTIRIDEDIKQDAETLFNKIGLTMSSAINVFFRQAIREQSIPFELKAYDKGAASSKQAREELKQTLRLMREESVKNGTDGMSMEEINAEIAACRREERRDK